MRKSSAENEEKVNECGRWEKKEERKADKGKKNNVTI